MRTSCLTLSLPFLSYVKHDNRGANDRHARFTTHVCAAEDEASFAITKDGVADFKD